MQTSKDARLLLETGGHHDLEWATPTAAGDHYSRQHRTVNLVFRTHNPHARDHRHAAHRYVFSLMLADAKAFRDELDRAIAIREKGE
jgi:hypothetical protein